MQRTSDKLQQNPETCSRPAYSCTPVRDLYFVAVPAAGLVGAIVAVVLSWF